MSFRSALNSSFWRKTPWYNYSTTKLLSLPFCIRYKEMGAGAHICTSHAEYIRTLTPHWFSVIRWRLLGGQRPSGWCHGQRGQIGWTALRQCVCLLHQGLDTVNRTENSKAYNWPGAHIGGTVHLPPADVGLLRDLNDRQCFPFMGTTLTCLWCQHGELHLDRDHRRPKRIMVYEIC